MNKELEALERLKTAPTFMGGTAEYQACTKSETLLLQDYEIVKQALLELQSIKEANPSEALECLEEIGFAPLNECCGYPYTRISDEYNENIETIKQALLKAEKDEKIILGIEDYLNQRIKVEPLGDVRKAFIEIRNQLQVIKEVLE